MYKVNIIQQDFYNTGFTKLIESSTDSSASINIGSFPEYNFVSDFISIQFQYDINNVIFLSPEYFLKCTKEEDKQNTKIYHYGFYDKANYSEGWLDEENSTVLNENINLVNFVPDVVLYNQQQNFIDINVKDKSNYYEFKITEKIDKNNPSELTVDYKLKDTTDTTVRNFNISFYTKDKKDFDFNNSSFNRVKTELDLCYNYEKDSIAYENAYIKVNNVNDLWYHCPTIKDYYGKFNSSLNIYQTPKETPKKFVIDASKDSSLLLAFNEDDMFTPKKNRTLKLNINTAWGKDLEHMSERQKVVLNKIIPSISKSIGSMSDDIVVYYKPYIRFGSSEGPYVKLCLDNLQSIGNKDLTKKTVNCTYILSDPTLKQEVSTGQDYYEKDMDYPLGGYEPRIVYYGTTEGTLEPRYENLINLFNPSFGKTTDYDFYIENNGEVVGQSLKELGDTSQYTPTKYSCPYFKDLFGNTSTFYTTFDVINTASNGVPAYVSNSSAWFTIDSSTFENSTDPFVVNINMKMHYETGLSKRSDYKSIHDVDSNINYVDIKAVHEESTTENSSSSKDSSIYNAVIISTIESGGNIYNKNNNPNVNIYLRSFEKENGLSSSSIIPFFPAEKIASFKDDETTFIFNSNNTRIWINGIVQNIDQESTTQNDSLIINCKGPHYIYKKWGEDSKDVNSPYIKLWFEIETKSNGWSYWKLCGDVSLGGVKKSDSTSDASSGDYYWNNNGELRLCVQQFTIDKSQDATIYKRFVENRPYLYDTKESKPEQGEYVWQNDSKDGYASMYFSINSSNDKNYYDKFLNKDFPCLPLWWPRNKANDQPSIGIPFIDLNSGILKDTPNSAIKKKELITKTKQHDYDYKK